MDFQHGLHLTLPTGGLRKDPNTLLRHFDGVYSGIQPFKGNLLNIAKLSVTYGITVSDYGDKHLRGNSRRGNQPCKNSGIVGIKGSAEDTLRLTKNKGNAVVLLLKTTNLLYGKTLLRGLFLCGGDFFY